MPSPIPSTRNETCTVCNADLAFLRSTERPDYEKPGRQVKVVDLFCGCGGLSLGLAEAAKRLGSGFDVRLALDHDENAVSVFRANFPQARAQCSPVEKFIDGALGAKLSASEKALAREVGAVDVLVGGPPCQGNSDLNNHTRRHDPRNAQYARMARAAAVLRPSAVVIENVPAVRHDVDKVVDVTIDALTSLGYSVNHDVLDLSLLGAPQRRRRHVVVAVRSDICGSHRLPQSVSARCPLHMPRPISWAIRDLLNASGSIFNTASNPTRENSKRMAYLFNKGVYDLPNRLRPKCHHSEHSYRSMYGRLRWEKAAQTLTTGFGSMGQGRYVHPLRQRTITPHEAARIQMLPDFFDFSNVGSRSALAKLIGNVVPPVLGIALGIPVLEMFFRSSKESAQERKSA